MDTHDNILLDNSAEDYCIFKIQEKSFAIEITSVKEIVAVQGIIQDIIGVPTAPTFLFGVINLRGTIIPIITINHLLKLEHIGIKDAKNCLLVESHESFLAFLIDNVVNISSIIARDINKEDFSDSLISGIFKKDNHLVSIIDIDKLIGIMESST